MKKIVLTAFFCFGMISFYASAQETDSAKTVKIALRDVKPLKSSDPLIIIDGNKQLIRSKASLSTIDPNLIESVEVLKDSAATALYGPDGSSGVVIIKTKQGKSNLGSVSTPQNLSDADVRSKVTGIGLRPTLSSRKDIKSDSTRVRMICKVTIDDAEKPLFIIDGKIIKDSDVKNIKPDQIESINVLKEASATAIYGARAANGVIIIITKKSKSTSKKN